MRSVDTNVLIRALTGDDPAQAAAASAFIQDRGPVWVSHIVLLETVWVLESVYECGKTQIADALQRILDNRDLAVQEPGIIRAALTHYRTKGRVNFEDCLILETAKAAGHVPLATFDKALGKAEGAMTLTPTK